ncbi:MAG TPA: hypothetical protein VKU60_07215, partial [Chloroflexota bacterium]|nr:hypothetical protein [Chloroflexota bacterium]
QPPRGEVLSRLGRVLLTPGVDPWQLPQEFWTELGEIGGKYEPALVALGAFQALDLSLQPVRDLRIPARRVSKSFFHGDTFWVSPQHALPSLERHSGKSPSRWLSFVRIIPENPVGARLQVLALDPHLDHLLCPRPTAQSGRGTDGLRIAVSPLRRAIVNGARPIERLWLDHGSYSAYILDEQGKPDNLIALLEKRVLPACVEYDAAVLLLPELTVSPKLRDKLAQLLKSREAERATQPSPRKPPRPVLVVAGSYHERVEGDRYVNRSVVLDYRGMPAMLRPTGQQWIHDKVERYSFRKESLGTKALQQWEVKLGLDAPGIKGAAEPPDLGTHFVLVETTIGRIGVALCIDYFNRFGSFTDDLQGSWLDWILVPSASTRLHEFEAIAGHLAPKGAATVVVNACWVPEAFIAWDKQWCGLAHLPGDKGRWIGASAASSEPASARRTVPASGCLQGCDHPEDGCVFVFNTKRRR